MKNLFRLMSAIVLVCACTRHDPYSADNYPHSAADGLPHEMIVLGERLEDPYTVQNMSKALFSLYPTKSSRGEVETTDLYVRFLPKDQDDCDRLAGLGVNLIDHPLDYEILEEGDYYRDPGIDDEEITWQYAVVSPDFNFPNGIRYEIIDECYIAENASEQSKAVFGDVDWEAVERESFRLTGNEKLLSDPVKGKYSPTIPHGRITIIDEDLRSEPVGVAGVRVSCNVFVKFARTYTDEQGYYTMPKKFSSDIRYRLVFKNKMGFNIGFNLLLVPASMSTLGRHSPDGIDVVVSKYSDRKLFCRSVVNNAGYEYYSRCKESGYSMSTPPSNLRIWIFYNLTSSSAPMLQHGAILDRSVLGKYLGEYLPLIKIFLPDITMGVKESGDYRTVYNTAIHEMAHASHWSKVGNDYWDPLIKYVIGSFVSSGFTTYGLGNEPDHGYCEVAESWAYYIQSRFDRDRYGSGANFGGGFWFSPQSLLFLDDRGMDRFKIFKALTPEVIDREKLQDKLIELYPESKSLINQAFDRYE